MKLTKLVFTVLFLFLIPIFQGNLAAQEAVRAESLKIDGVDFNLWLANPFQVKSDAILNPFQPFGSEKFFRDVKTLAGSDAPINRSGSGINFINISEIALSEVGKGEKIGFLADITYQGLITANGGGAKSVTIPLLGLSINGVMSETDVVIALIAGFQRYMLQTPESSNSIRSVEITTESFLGLALNRLELTDIYNDFKVGDFYEALENIGFGEAIATVSKSIGALFPDWKIAEMRASIIDEVVERLSGFDQNGRGIVREDLSAEEKRSANREIAKLTVDQLIHGRIDADDLVAMNGDKLPNGLTSETSLLHRLLKENLGESLREDFVVKSENLTAETANKLINLDLFARGRFQAQLPETGILELAEACGAGAMIEPVPLNSKAEEVAMRLAGEFVRGERQYRPNDKMDPVRRARLLKTVEKIAEIAGEVK